ncbi:MAG TPA: hypothetical protein PKD53_01470 [Chloroflexaceae bacterium]|nr:hypothetical protein [Chloroflexaceae bacterium]
MINKLLRGHPLALIAVGLVSGAVLWPLWRAIAALLLGFALSGYLVAVLVRARVPQFERHIYSLSIAFCLAATGGLLLYVVGLPLNAAAWLGYYTVLNGGMVGLILWTRQVTAAELLRLLLHTGAGRTVRALGDPLARGDILWNALLTALIVGLALIINQVGSLTQPQIPYTMLWFIPAPSDEAEPAPGLPLHWHMAIRNMELRETSFRLEVVVDGAVAETYDVGLLPRNQTWTETLAVTEPPPEMIELRLYRQPDTTTVYRHVRVSLRDAIASPSGREAP